MDINGLTIEGFRKGLLAKEFSAREAARAHFEAIGAKNGDLNAYLHLSEARAFETAGIVDQMVAHGDELPELAGVPMALKDNLLIKGERATAASKILENYTASYDAHVVAKLKEQHAVFLGKTNLDEFAMGASTENSAFGVTRNPHDTSRVAGGSSGGSAAAVAADLAVAALGSDTGGSIRFPANLCGVVGLKPTYGAVSRSGLIAMASGFDQIGPITKTVRDAATVFRAIAGRDGQDSTSRDHDYGDELANPDLGRVRGLTVGLPAEYFIEGLDRDVAAAIDRAIERLKRLGLKFKQVSLPHTRYALAAYYIIVPAEVSSNLARFDGIRYARIKSDRPGNANLMDIYLDQRGRGFGPETKRRIILGTFVLSSGYYDAYYTKAQKVRALVARDFAEAFESVDVLLTPVSPTPAFTIGEKADDPLSMYLVDIFTITANLAGIPGISIPVEPPREGCLPVGFQLLGKPFREADILGIGQYYEQETA